MIKVGTDHFTGSNVCVMNSKNGVLRTLRRRHSLRRTGLLPETWGCVKSHVATFAPNVYQRGHRVAPPTPNEANGWVILQPVGSSFVDLPETNSIHLASLSRPVTAYIGPRGYQKRPDGYRYDQRIRLSAALQPTGRFSAINHQEGTL